MRKENMIQKELKEKYIEIIVKEIWETKNMQDYARKNVSYVVELENGDIIDIDKPSIETRFCFGAGMYLNATDEQLNYASDMAEKARTDVDYFLKENLSDIDRMIEKLENKSYKVYTYLHYSGQEIGSKLKAFTVCDALSSPEHNQVKWSACRDLKEMSDADREKLLDGYKEARKMFVKRLETYLKKYGLSKIDSWSYLVD